MQKHDRLEQDVKMALSQIIMYEVKNTSVAGTMISVTDVKITPDQKYAKVYVSIFGKQNKEKVLEGLQKTKGFIRSELGRRVRMRNVPELVFTLDDSMEYGAYMDEVIHQVIEQDSKKREE